ncbi:MAG TPA: dTDP-glucose 4,6-dehydratase [Gammaproteobacteria bacterium]|nr:dTDP-glucose 4,6-dehydratase [Gammaproteobacteria bacterium]
MQTWLVTGGAGFIGANFVLAARRAGLARIINLDLLTYAGHLENLAGLKTDRDHVFVQGDIGDEALVTKLLTEHVPDAVVNFAAESHVDRSILGPQAFIQTNIVGTHSLLTCAHKYWKGLDREAQQSFRFLHVSTDEVYGSLGPKDPAFSEDHQYQPNSPYAASKAAADHLVRAYHHTYGLPVLTTNCSNNYGPYQHPEKLIPLMIQNALRGKPLPVYGDGQQVRDWLYVEDHCTAIRTVLERGRPGETYNIGGNAEKANLEIVHTLCRLLDSHMPANAPHAKLIQHVADRPGHDRRYAINAAKIKRELGWQPASTFEQGIARTVQWYLDNDAWVQAVSNPEHQEWLRKNYQQSERNI